MSNPKLISTLDELYAATLLFDDLIRTSYDDLSPKQQKVVQNAFSHTRSFIAFPRTNGDGYIIGFSKFVGHQMKSIPDYDAVRKNISGSDSERAIGALGVATDYALGSSHDRGSTHAAPAELAQAVRDFVAIADKTPNSLSWIRLMPLPDAVQGKSFARTKTYDVLLAALKAAHLTKVEREHLFAELTA